MSDFFCKSGSGVVQYSAKTWSTGERMVIAQNDGSANATLARTAVWECTTGGTSTGTPAWPASISYDTTEVNDSGVVWKARKPGYSSGSTVDWAFATIFMEYLAQAMTAEGAGARGLISNNHSESSASPQTFAPTGGTAAAPLYAVVVSDADTSNFTAVTTPTAQMTTTSNYGIIVNNPLHVRGMIFNVGTGGSAAHMTCSAYSGSGGLMTTFEQCDFRLVNTSTTSVITVFGGSTTKVAHVIWRDCNIKFASTFQRLAARGGKFEWIGGSVLSGGSSPSELFVTAASLTDTDASIEGVDFSNLSSTFDIVDTVSSSAAIRIRMNRCKMPSGWSGKLFETKPTTVTQHRVEMVNCDDGDTNYRIRIEDAYGALRESTDVTTGDATDGVTPVSYKIDTTGYAANASHGFEPNYAAVWNDTVGGALSVTLELVANHGSAVTDADVVMRINLPGVSGSSLGTIVDTRPALLATPSTLTTSTKAWDGSASARVDSTAYALGDVIKLASNSGRVFFCTTAGTSDSTEPAGYASAVDGGSVNDGTAVFRAGRRYKITKSVTPYEKGWLYWKPIVHLAGAVVYTDRTVTVV